MGVCSSKAKRGSPDVNDSNSSIQQQDTRFQRPTNQNRRSITYARPRDPGDNDDTLRRYDATNQTEEMELGGLKIRYGYMSQRGYYPDDGKKPNQDATSIDTNFTGEASDAYFAVYDGHGRDGEKCAQYAKNNLPKKLAQQIKRTKEHQLKEMKRTDLEPKEGALVELNKLQTHAASRKSHLQVNKAMHLNERFEDALSGTTAISALVQGRRNRITISNVGDSRAILGKKVEPNKDKNKSKGADNHALFRAIPLSKDHTPYRRVEKKRIMKCGARILSLDQIEGLEPVLPDNDDEDDFELGENIDEDGDPPRVWHPTMDYPGTAFTRSLGDALAEDLGVIADPEIVTRELEEGDNIIVLASDGVFEFLTNQSVIDICAKFDDPFEACKAVIAESYELWLQYELRTDDITMICIFVDNIAKLDDNFLANASIMDIEKDIPDNLVMDSQPAKKDSGKINKRLTEMKQLLEESLQDGGKGPFDFNKYFNEKTDAEKEGLSHSIKGSVMLQSMSPEQLDIIYDLMQPLNVQKGEWVIRQGEDGDRFYIVDEGKFEVRISPEAPMKGSKEDKGGTVVHIYEGSQKKKFHPSFGELALLYDAPRAASIVAQTDGKLWALDRAALKAVMLDTAGKKGLVSILRSIVELEHYKNEEIEDFASAMEEVTITRGSKIATANSAGTALFILDKGTAVINLEKNGEKMSSTLQKMDYFGQEIMVNEKSHYLATVEALTDVRCFKLEKSAIDHSMKKLQAVREGRNAL